MDEQVVEIEARLANLRIEKDKAESQADKDIIEQQISQVTKEYVKLLISENAKYEPVVLAQQEFGDWNSPVAVIQAANKAKATRDYCYGS